MHMRFDMCTASNEKTHILLHIYTTPNGGRAHKKLLTCPSALAPPLGADEVLFLKGMPTFHPFVSGWKEKRRKSARKG